MSKLDKKNTEQQVENTQEKKKPIRRASFEYQGATYLDDKFKKPGKVYRAVRDKPGRIKYMESMGYTIVRDQTSDETLTGTASNLGSAQTIEMGKTHSQPGVWMECDLDEFNERQAEKAKRNVEMFEETKNENTYKGQEQPK